MADVVRVSQEATEVLYAPPNTLRVTQVAVEALYRVPVPAFISQVAVEILLPSRSYEVYSFDVEFDS